MSFFEINRREALKAAMHFTIEYNLIVMRFGHTFDEYVYN